MMAVKEERREGHSYIEPSWIASHIYKASADLEARDGGVAYSLSTSFEYGGTVEILVVFNSVAVLDDALCAAKGRWCTAHLLVSPTISSEASACILVRCKRIRVYLNAHGSRRMIS